MTHYDILYRYYTKICALSPEDADHLVRQGYPLAGPATLERGRRQRERENVNHG